MPTSIRQRLLGTVAACALASGLAASAHGAPVFTTDPDAIYSGAGVSSLMANNISGTSSALIEETSGGGGPGSTQSESGYIYFTTLDLGTTTVETIGNHSTGGYGLALTFNATSTTTTGTVGSAGNQNALTTLTFTLYAIPNSEINTDLGTPASASTTTNGVFTPATMTLTDATVLGTGNLISGVASFNASGGPAFNATALFDLCTGSGTASQGGAIVADAACTSGLGSSYFIAPIPFFDIAFDESNTTPSNLETNPGFPSDGNGTYAAITSDTAQVNFVGVPEPSTLALFGSGLIGLGLPWVRRRRRRG
jgi:hypothetical protein